MGNTQKLLRIELNPDTIDGINGEFAYQSTLQGSGRADAREHGVEGQLVTLLPYTLEAFNAWAKNPGDEAALDALRKVAAIALRALVLYGCPKRKLPEAIEADSVAQAIADHDAAMRRIAEAQQVKFSGVYKAPVSDWEARNQWAAWATRAFYESAKGVEVHNINSLSRRVADGIVSKSLEAMVETVASGQCGLGTGVGGGPGNVEESRRMIRMAKAGAAAVEASDKVQAGDVVCLKADSSWQMTVGRIDGHDDAWCYWFTGSVLTTKTIPVAALTKVPSTRATPPARRVDGQEDHGQDAHGWLSR